MYRRLKREKGDRSLSEVIEERLEATTRLADVAGQGILTAVEAAKGDVARLSERTLSRLDDEAR